MMDISKPKMLSESLAQALKHYGEPQLLVYLQKVQTLTQGKDMTQYFKEYPVSTEHLFKLEFFESQYRTEVFQILNQLGVTLELGKPSHVEAQPFFYEILNLSHNAALLSVDGSFEPSIKILSKIGKKIELNSESFEASIFYLGVQKTLMITKNLDEIMSEDFIFSVEIDRANRELRGESVLEMHHFVASYVEKQKLDSTLESAKVGQVHKL